MGFIYDVFLLCEESLKNSDLYNTDCIHNFSGSVNYNTFDYESGHTKNFHDSSIHKDFLHFEFGDIPC